MLYIIGNLIISKLIDKLQKNIQIMTSKRYCRAVNRQPGFRPMDLAELVQHSELIWKRMLMTS